MAIRFWDCGFEFCLGRGSFSLVSVVCCQVEVSALGLSLVQMSPTKCGVSECDREASIMRRSSPSRCCCAMGKKLCRERNSPVSHIISLCRVRISALKNNYGRLYAQKFY